MINALLALICLSFLMNIGMAALVFVVRFTLLHRMGQTESVASKVISLETRLDTVEKAPDRGSEAYRKTLERLTDVEVGFNGLKRQQSEFEKDLRRQVNKDNARSKRSKPDPEDESGAPEGDTQTEPQQIDLVELAKKGLIAPLSPQQVAGNGHQRISTFGQISR